jgi:hypothetical protein
MIEMRQWIRVVTEGAAVSAGGPAPIVSVEALMRWGESIGVYASVSEQSDEIELAELERVEDAPKGHGAEFMRALCAYADRMRKPIYLATIGWSDTLPAYYRQFGFVDTERDEESGDLTMVRQPKARLSEASRSGHLPAWLIDAPRVDVFARSPDAEFILDPDEGSFEWRECQAPVSAFKQTSAMIDTPAEEAKRFARIRRWMKERGGAAAAIQESPVLALWWRGLYLLDGWHRMQLAQKEGMTTFPTLVGLVPNARAARAANIG